MRSNQSEDNSKVNLTGFLFQIRCTYERINGLEDRPKSFGMSKGMMSVIEVAKVAIRADFVGVGGLRGTIRNSVLHILSVPR